MAGAAGNRKRCCPSQSCQAVNHVVPTPKGSTKFCYIGKILLDSTPFSSSTSLGRIPQLKTPCPSLEVESACPQTRGSSLSPDPQRHSPGEHYMDSMTHESNRSNYFRRGRRNTGLVITHRSHVGCLGRSHTEAAFMEDSYTICIVFPFPTISGLSGILSTYQNSNWIFTPILYPKRTQNIEHNKH